MSLCPDREWVSMGDLRYNVPTCNISRTALIVLWSVVIAMTATEIYIALRAIRRNYLKHGAKVVIMNAHGAHKFLLLAAGASLALTVLAGMKLSDVERFSVGNEVGITVIFLVTSAVFFAALASFLITFLDLSLSQARFANSDFTTKLQTRMRALVPVYVAVFWLCVLDG